ncbi:F0F1 ATP synthase subunit delta [Hydrogenophaga sp.]|uniref:F0F1 ATP synthase subunit delta n=1 Tax=Hydrogenophaga sp. TaxID=1904254 RepID=UPI002730AE0D|nr:F0F1 ATP synthase subunit delta [Hydrogenophaga sp.]MDP2015535.1 F0F1 ATP synthase subunit delta [Hydrogenophaga sp.]MDP3810174.1 F0F1 ATP synthase subunit delta [Hydrogenophaga sp.]
MAEIATIARPYAEALFQASGSGAAGAAAWLDELASVAADEQLRQYADNPRTTPEQVFSLVTGVIKTSLPTMAQNFLRTVIDNGRLAALPEIADQFRALKNAQQGAFDAVVYSAFAIDSAALADLSGVLEKRFARKLNLQVELQPELIGGIRVVVGDEVLDTSIKARLEHMKTALTAA